MKARSEDGVCMSKGGEARPVRVFFVDPFGIAGLAHYNYCLCQALVRAGADVTLLTSTMYELDSWQHDFQVERLAELWDPFTSENLRRGKGLVTKVGKGLAYWRSMIRIIRRIYAARPDVLHLTEMFFSMDLVFLWLMKLSGARLVQTCHNVRTFTADDKARRVVGRGRVGDWIHSRMYRCFDGIIFHTEDSKREFTECFGGHSASLHVIPHGNYMIHGAKTVPSKDSARRRLGLPLDRKTVLFFGFIKRYKGLIYLVRAFEPVLRAIPDCQLVVAGAAYFGSGLEECRRAASELGISDRIRWDVQYVPNESIRDYFAAADVVALPYVKIYQSGVLQLAYAFERPVVATDVGGVKEIVEQDGTGVLVRPRDSAALAEGLIQVLSDEALAVEMGRRGRQLAETKYGWDDIAAKTMQVYEEAMDQ